MRRLRNPAGWAALACLCLPACASDGGDEPLSAWKIIVGVAGVVALLWKLRGWLGGGSRRGGDFGGGDWGGGGDCGGGD